MNYSSPYLALVSALSRPTARHGLPLVEPPVADHRDPVPVAGVERQVRGGDRAAQQRGVNTSGRPLLGHQMTARPPPRPATCRQVDVDQPVNGVGRVHSLSPRGRQDKVSQYARAGWNLATTGVAVRSVSFAGLVVDQVRERLEVLQRLAARSTRRPTPSGWTTETNSSNVGESLSTASNTCREHGRSRPPSPIPIAIRPTR